MAITTSGLFGLTEEKFRRSLAWDTESETLNKYFLITDAATPNFDTMDFRDDLNPNENTGTGYTAGGVIVTGTELTIGAPAAGQIRYDHNDPSWATSTITSAMAGVGYGVVGTAATDPLHYLQDFVTAVSTVAGTLLVTIAANGVYYEDYVP
jgi:hypothetical protein